MRASNNTHTPITRRLMQAMTWKRRYVAVLLPALAAVGLAMASIAPAASTPKWYVGGQELTETETLGGVAEPSSLKAIGVTTQCQHSYYVANLFNSSGLGKGELTYLPVYGCTASGQNCVLNKVEPTKLPWPMHTVFEGTKPYVVIENVTIEASYSGWGCPLYGTHVMTGSLGGALENGSQKTVFNAATAQATGAALKSGFIAVEFTGSYNVEMVGPERRGEVVEAR